MRDRIPDPPQRIAPVSELGEDSVAVEIDASMVDVYQLVIDLDRRAQWMSEKESVERPAITERLGLRHLCVFRGLAVAWTTVKSDFADETITYVEDERMIDKYLPFRESYIMQRRGAAKTLLEFRLKWLCSPDAPREMSDAILADLKQSLETIKVLCEKPKG